MNCRLGYFFSNLSKKHTIVLKMLHANFLAVSAGTVYNRYFRLVDLAVKTLICGKKLPSYQTLRFYVLQYL